MWVYFFLANYTGIVFRSRRFSWILLYLKMCCTLAAEDPPNLDEEIREMNRTLQKENASLHALNTALHEKHHTMSLKVSGACPSLGGARTPGDP